MLAVAEKAESTVSNRFRIPTLLTFDKLDRVPDSG
jgi:hypothetical protein